jgi:LAGLIDADG DNA endonuclease family protein
MQEVSSAHSTRPDSGRGSPRAEATVRRKPFTRNPALRPPVGKEQIHSQVLPPNYVAGFIDGEGSFSVSVNRQVTTRSGIEVRPEFEMELRADDRDILERILVTIGCGKVYDCSYERYGWYPHSKYKISSTRELAETFIPFLDRHPLQAKKAQQYVFFREIVLAVRQKEHLTDVGFNRILALRERIRSMGKKHRMEAARIRENRSSGGVGHRKMIPIPPVMSEERGAPEVPVDQDRR